MFAELDNQHPWAPPSPADASGAQRRVGVEIELGGLDESTVAGIVADELGGAVSCTGAAEWQVSGGALGEMKIVLDTRFRKKLVDVGSEGMMQAVRGLVPVEIITAPLAPEDLAGLDRLCARLRGMGAIGTRGDMLLGLGVHLNVAVTGSDLGDILPTLTAYALLEDLLRREMQLDTTRRLLPFSAPYPRSFVDALAGNPPGDLDALIGLYLAETPTRNRGLDMLPFLATIVPDQVAVATGQAGGVSARPAYHYRLPDSRIDEADWSVTLEWNRWVEVERVAATPDLLDALKEGWKAHRASWSTLRGDWAESAAAICAEARQ